MNKEKLNEKSSEKINPNYDAKLMLHNKRSSLVKIILFFDPYYTYISISKHGTIGLLDSQLKLKNCYKLDLHQRSVSNHKDSSNKKVGRYVEVTDACHMADCKKLVIAVNNRTIQFYDISAITHLEEFIMYGLTSNISTLTYHYETNKQNETESKLFFGDDCGCVHLLNFKQQETSLFKKLDIERTTQDIYSHSEYVDYQQLDQIHRTAILEIQFIPHNSTLLTCAEGYAEPLIIQNLHNYIKMYIFRHQKGIICFDYSFKFNTLITGGRNCLIHVWNPYVPFHPIAILSGHHAPVLGVKIDQTQSLIMSYSVNMVLKLWDITEHSCLQTIVIQLPMDTTVVPKAAHLKSPLSLDSHQQDSIIIKVRDYVFVLRRIIYQDSNLHLQKIAKTQFNPLENKEMIKCKDSTQSLVEKYQNWDLRQLLEDDISVTTLATVISNNPLLLNSAFLPMLSTRLSESMINSTLRPQDILKAVNRGLPFSTLKLVDTEPVNIIPTLPPIFDINKIGVLPAKDNLLSVNMRDKWQGSSRSPRSRRQSYVKIEAISFNNKLEVGHAIASSSRKSSITSLSYKTK